MALDLYDARAQLVPRQAEIAAKLAGLNVLQTLPLTAEESAVIGHLQADYHEQDKKLQTLLTAIDEELAVGYPALPSADVPASMLEHIHQILTDIQEAEALLHTEAVAAAVKVSFTGPVPK